MSCPTDWKRTYHTVREAEDAYWRTPATRHDAPHAFLLPYWCDAHGGYHLGHFDVLGKRAYRGWGVDAYNAVNAYRRPHRRMLAETLRKSGAR